MNVEIRKVGDIRYVDTLYPRTRPNETKIEEYAENVELLPPIEINQKLEETRSTLNRKVDRWIESGVM